MKFKVGDIVRDKEAVYTYEIVEVGPYEQGQVCDLLTCSNKVAMVGPGWDDYAAKDVRTGEVWFIDEASYNLVQAQ